MVRLSDGHDAGLRSDFETWRGQSIDHEIAYEQEMAAWEQLDRLKSPLSPDMSANPDLPAQTPVLPRTSRSVFTPRKKWRAAAAAVLLVAAVSGLAGTMLGGAPAYATAIGERRTIVLDDGSRIELNTDSMVIVRYARNRRVVELVRGEAMFRVGSDARPFQIEAKGARLNLSTGELAVRLADTAVKATVKTGNVLASIDDAVATTQPVTSLTAGSEAIFGDTQISAHGLSSLEVDRALAWQQDAIALDGQTLAEAASEFNRYNMRKIEVVGADARRLQVGGYFRASDVEGFVTALTKAFPVQASADSDGDIVLRGKR